MRKILKKIRSAKWRRYLLSTILFFLSLQGLKQRHTILALKNKYCGKRCFIIGNGPSLRAEDLELLHLHNEISFAANHISKIFPKTNWRPTFYCVSDEGLQRKIQNIMSETSADLKFFTRKYFFYTRKVAGNCIYLNADTDRKLLTAPLFAKNILNKIYSIATVTYISIQIAVYAGFKEIYLIGVDHSYPKMHNADGSIQEKHKARAHFYNDANDENQKRLLIPFESEMDIAYKKAKEHADEHGISIFNATRGGGLEIFPRVDFDTLFPTL